MSIRISGGFRRCMLARCCGRSFWNPSNSHPIALPGALGVPRTRIERLAREETALTADTALRLSRYFGTTPEFWMNLQIGYELECAKRALTTKLGKIEPRSTPTRELRKARSRKAAA